MSIQYSIDIVEVVFYSFSILSNKEERDNFTKNNSNSHHNDKLHLRHLKIQDVGNLPPSDIIDADVKSIALPFPISSPGKPQLESKTRFNCFAHKCRKDEVDLTQRMFKVTKINQTGKKQPRSLLLSAYGISIIRRSGKRSST